MRSNDNPDHFFLMVLPLSKMDKNNSNGYNYLKRLLENEKKN